MFYSTDEKYYVGLDFAFNIDIRPRNMSGVILAVHSVKSSSDFILLQLVDGKVQSSMESLCVNCTNKHDNHHTVSTNSLCFLQLLNDMCMFIISLF